MYDPIDRHGWSTISNGYYIYSPQGWYDKYKKLEAEHLKLKNKLKMYEDLKKDNNIHVIDGRICYKTLRDISVTSSETDDDYQMFFFISGQAIYKDIDTDEIMAIKDISTKIKYGESNKCGKL